MTTIQWTLTGTLNTDDAKFSPEDWLGRPAATPEDIRDAFLEAAQSGEFDALQRSDVDGFMVEQIDDKHVHSPVDSYVVEGRELIPRMCRTCGKRDPEKVVR